MTRNDYLEAYKNGYNNLINLLNKVPVKAITYLPSPGKWTIKEIVIHLIDDEANRYIRFRKLIAENGSSISPYEQNEWAIKLSYINMDLDNYLTMFKVLRENTYEMLKMLPDEAWDNFINHPEKGKQTLDELLKISAVHDDAHMKQINRNLDAWNN
jgi:hypothetical protein